MKDVYWLCFNQQCPGHIGSRCTAIVKATGHGGSWSEYGSCPRCGSRGRAFVGPLGPEGAAYQGMLAHDEHRQQDAILATEAD